MLSTPINRDERSLASRPPVRRPSRFLLAVYHVVARVQFFFFFRALRIAHPERFPVKRADRPLIIFFNHPSMWDGLVVLLLQLRLLPSYNIYVPLANHLFHRYPALRYLGFFGVHPGLGRGPGDFVEDCKQILARPDAILWMSPEGEFKDPRSRPIRLRRGLATLLTTLGPVTVVPLALEYCLWEKLRMEALASWGEPIESENAASRSVAEWTDLMTDSLTATLDELSGFSIRREHQSFQLLLYGRFGFRNLVKLLRDVRLLIFRG